MKSRPGLQAFGLRLQGSVCNHQALSTSSEAEMGVTCESNPSPYRPLLSLERKVGPGVQRELRTVGRAPGRELVSLLDPSSTQLVPSRPGPWRRALCT